VLAQDVDQLHADRIGKRLCDRGHALGLGPLDRRIDDRLAARLAGSALLLGDELEIDGPESTYFD